MSYLTYHVLNAYVIWRIIYRVDSDAVVVADVFAKKTRSTPKHVIDTSRRQRARLTAKGWRVGSAAEFLELSPEEAALVETRLALSRSLRQRRVARKLTQGDLARKLNSSQSRVAKMEACDRTVSVDLLLKALFALGAQPKDIARALQHRTHAA